METAKRPRVVIVGGGFGGIEVALQLKGFNKYCEVLLISDKTYFEYYPGLYKVVTGMLPTEVSIPLWMIFDKTPIRVEHDKITLFDTEQKTVTGESGTVYHYDYLVIAMGSQTNYFGIEGLPEHSFGFKSVHEALRLKKHFYHLFIEGNGIKDDLISLLHILIVGAGPSGVELAGDLKIYLKELAQKHHVDTSLITIDLIEAAPRILPMLPPEVSAKAEWRLRKLGINIFTNRALLKEDIETVHLKDMQLKTETVVWTAGTKIHDYFRSIPGAEENEKKRIIVNEYLSLPLHPQVFIIGDGAATPFTGLAQTAMHNGKYVGKAIRSLLQGKKPAIYKPHKGAYVIPIGHRWALFVWRKLQIYGLVPWLLRSLIDLRYYAHILSPGRVWYMLREGKKYHGLAGGCEQEKINNSAPVQTYE